jgi:hypothetical protein
MSEQERPGTLAEALIALQARLPRITKDATGQAGTREYPYATLAGIHDAVFPLLADAGLYWSCRPTLYLGGGEPRFVLSYSLTHISGDEIDGLYPLPEASPQVQGSAITYARRYCLISVLGIAPVEDDDDGKRAEDDHRERQWHPPANPSSRRATRERRTAAEDTDWTTSPAGDDTPGTITNTQLAAIQDYWISLGIDAEDRKPLIMSALDLTEIKRTRDLSRVQGDELIAYLRGLETSTEGGA